MLIDILIPTYNRSKDVLSNLSELRDQIVRYNLQDKVCIILSDNCSQDDTETLVGHFIEKEAQNVSIQYHRNATNIGLEPNCVQVLSYAQSPYVLFIGDDDFIPHDYLPFCIESIKNVPDLGCIIPGIILLSQDGSRTVIRKKKDPITFPAGYESVYLYSHYGHQLSGVLCIRENLLEDYLCTPQYRNLYLFIYFIANRLAKYAGIYAPNFQTLVNNFNAKDWGYNAVGLLDEVYKSYYPFITVYGEKKTAQLLLRFTVLHSYRLLFKSKSISKLREQYRYLLKTTPPLKGFKWGLFKFFVKEYLRGMIKKTK